MTKHRQKRHGYYYFRMRVPQDLQDRFGVTEIKKSLKNHSALESKLICDILSYNFNGLFKIMRCCTKHKLTSIDTQVGTIDIYPISYAGNCAFWKEIEDCEDIPDESFVRIFISYCCFRENKGDTRGKENSREKLSSEDIDRLSREEIESIAQACLENQDTIVVKSVDGSPKQAKV